MALAGGITGQAMSYTSQQYRQLVDRVLDRAGEDGRRGTSYERVVLYVQNSGQGVLVKGLTTRLPSQYRRPVNPSNEADLALINNRTFLVAFADQLIYAQASRARLSCQPGSNGIST